MKDFIRDRESDKEMAINTGQSKVYNKAKDNLKGNISDNISDNINDKQKDNKKNIKVNYSVNNMANKIVSASKLQKIIEKKRSTGMKVVFTNGCFDILHVGHARYLAAAREKGDLLVLGINSDSSVRKLKGDKRPLVPEYERAELLSYLEMVDYIVIFEEITAEELITKLKPDVYVKGGDYIVDDLPEAGVVREYGGKIELIPVVEGASTTNIVERILERYSN
ncbi:MAG: D-glycero-beta-D-manno-heptose 1-phosphate adenylyltransferase [Halanaerobiales bacterium]